ncbi:MAG: PilZ domain-containing protein, partial [Leptospiraceae bacterium]|nr:PilZ domain-containing protein [Leptospiraceae bacterium]
SSVLNGKQLPDGLHIILSHVGTMERVQQRAYFRRNVQLTGQLQGCDGRITNLSGGGARVRLFPRNAAFNDTDPLGEGQECDLKFNLNETVVIECRVRIVACNLPDVHLEFIRIREGDRDRIVRHLNQLAHHAISPS